MILTVLLRITWIIASSSLSCGAFLLFFGRFTDLFGRKTQFVASLFLFAVLSLAAGFAKNGVTLDAINGVRLDPNLEKTTLDAKYLPVSASRTHVCFRCSSRAGFLRQYV